MYRLHVTNIIPALGYRVLLADPPWAFEAYSEKGYGRSPEAHYETMELEAIKALRQQLQFGRILESNVTLLLWTTGTYLAMAMELIPAWGFTYKSMEVWRKVLAGANPDTATVDEEQMGLGYHRRSTAELVLIATRGQPGLPKVTLKNLFSAEVGEHSEKPEVMHRRIEAGYGGPYLELFARKPRRGWVTWGKPDPDQPPGLLIA